MFKRELINRIPAILFQHQHRRASERVVLLDGGLAFLFRLPRGRYIVGYSLGDDGSSSVAN